MEYIPVYFSYLERLEDLTDAQFGALIRALLRFGAGQTPKLPEDPLVGAAYKLTRYEIARCMEDYAARGRERSEAARRAAAARWGKR